MPPRTGRRDGASVSRTSLRQRYRAWLQHHRLSAADSLVRILDRPVSSLMTWLVIGIALALPVGFATILDNVERLSSGWGRTAEMSLFLRSPLAPAEAEAFAVQVAARDDVSAARFVSREAALAEFAALSGFGDLLSGLDSNPLPHLVLVTPVGALDGDALAALREALASEPLVAEVVLDMAWLRRLQEIMTIGRRGVVAVGILLLLGVVLTLGNTVRLTIESRRDEIVVVKLVGGSDGFVRRPFLYTGLWYGVGGGLIGGLLVVALLWFLAAPVDRLAASYGSAFRLSGPGLMGVLNMVLAGGALGLAGAWLAVSRHLGEGAPEQSSMNL